MLFDCAEQNQQFFQAAVPCSFFSSLPGILAKNPFL